jgi:hypothetical protein
MRFYMCRSRCRRFGELAVAPDALTGALFRESDRLSAAVFVLGSARVFVVAPSISVSCERRGMRHGQAHPARPLKHRGAVSVSATPHLHERPAEPHHWCVRSFGPGSSTLVPPALDVALLFAAESDVTSRSLSISSSKTRFFGEVGITRSHNFKIHQHSFSMDQPQCYAPTLRRKHSYM